MSIKRKLVNIHTPPPQQGFLGRGHIARAVVQIPFSESDPFIMLMDDRLDKKDEEPAGGPHPHAGFETVTLILEGELGDGEHKMKAGDFQMMTAGSGVVHTETIEKKVKMQILQLWLNLPKKDRDATPRIQDLPAEHVPAHTEKGVQVKLYSGSMAGLTSPIQNYVPLIVAEFLMDPGTKTLQHLPANFNTFLYAIEGSVNVGAEEKLLQKDQSGWLNLFADDAQSELQLVAGEEGARFVLYAAKPQGEAIVSHGPFIADSSEDIKRLYQEYRQGKMPHIYTVAADQQLVW